MEREPAFSIGQEVQRDNRGGVPSAKYRTGVVVGRAFRAVNKHKPNINKNWHYDIRWEGRSQTDPVLEHRLQPIPTTLADLVDE